MSPRSQRRRIAVFAPTFPPAYLGGGPARTLSALVRDAPDTADVIVVAPDRDADESKLPVATGEWAVHGNAHVFYGQSDRAIGLVKTVGAVRSRKPDVLYLNSFFNFRYSIVPQMLAAVGFWGAATILIAPRGEFDPGALAIRPLKKKLYIRLFKMSGLYSSVTWHASAPMEARAIRNVWGVSARVLIRENETSLPAVAADPPMPASTTLTAAFLGRISPKKGLLVVLQALTKVSSSLILDIYGPEEDEHYVKQCKRVVDTLPSAVQVRFHGSVPPDEARAVLLGHDVLFMPTAGENFGHVIAESLSVSCPVMCTAATPWTELLERGAGMIIEPNLPDAWSEGIERVLSSDISERRAWREKAGILYNEWRQQPPAPHIFELFDEEHPKTIL